MLEQTERVAGRTARGVPRTSPDPVLVSRVRGTPKFETRFDPEAIEAASREWKLAAERLEVPVADLEAQVLDGLATAAAPKVDPKVRDHQLRRASWAASEMEFRVAGEASRQTCADAMARALELATFRDQTLWSMVDLERGMKDSAREQLEQERQRLADREQSLYDSLRQFEGKFATIRREARGTIMSLSDILFDFGKAELRRDAEINLAKVAVILVQFPEMDIQVEGHTDNIGSEEYNLKLSERRAAAVFAFLSEQGVTEERMSTKGYGMSQPVASNETPEGRQQNRRVDLVMREE
jgi:outer membrane protein OmpA-like peptidoglycan-associated protein